MCFADTTFDGRGGSDVASLAAVAGENKFEGWENAAVLTSANATTKLNGFSNVKVQGMDDETIKSNLSATLHNTARDNAFAAFGDTATFDVDGDNMFLIVAADQVQLKRDYNAVDNFEIADDLDFDLSAVDWDL